MQIGLAVEEVSGCSHATVGTVDSTEPGPASPVRREQGRHGSPCAS